MKRTYLGLLVLVWCRLAQAVPNDPATNGKCKDPDPNTEGTEAYACPAGWADKAGHDVNAACNTTADCNKNCCVEVDKPAFQGTCSDPDPSTGAPKDADFQCPQGTKFKTEPNTAKLACTSSAECEANCCTEPPVVTVTETIFTTTTITPWDSSSGVSGDSLASDSTDSLKPEEDVSNSGESSGFYMSGSSGFNLPLWVWCLSACLCCCLCLCLAMLCKPKAKKKKPVPKPVPPPKEPAPPPKEPASAPKVEEEQELLLPALMPLQPSYTPPYAQPGYGMPVRTYAQPGYGVGAYPGTLI